MKTPAHSPCHRFRHHLRFRPSTTRWRWQKSPIRQTFSRSSALPSGCRCQRFDTTPGRRLRRTHTRSSPNCAAGWGPPKTPGCRRGARTTKVFVRTSSYDVLRRARALGYLVCLHTLSLPRSSSIVPRVQFPAGPNAPYLRTKRPAVTRYQARKSLILKGFSSQCLIIRLTLTMSPLEDGDEISSLPAGHVPILANAKRPAPRRKYLEFATLSDNPRLLTLLSPDRETTAIVHRRILR